MERSSKITLAVIISVIALVGSYTYIISQHSSQEKLIKSEAGTSLVIEEGQSAYTDIQGNEIAIAENLGNVLVVNSWASWCPSCANQLPDLARLGNEFADKNVKVLAINRAEPKTTAVAFLTSISALDGIQLVLDPGDTFYSSIDGYAMPETLFYDAQGKIILQKRGLMTYEEIKEQIELILNQSSQSE